MFVLILFVFDLLFNLFMIALWPSVGKDLSPWLFTCAVLARLYESRGRAIAVTTASALASASASALLKMLKFLVKVFKSKRIRNDQELIQSDPTSCSQNEKGNN